MESLDWRCTACGAAFATPSDAPEPRCPKCLKRSSVVREEREAPAATEVRHEPETAPPPAIEEPEPESPLAWSSSRMLLLAALPSIIAALLMSGIGGFLAPPVIAIAAAVATAPLAGFLMTGSSANRVFTTIASMIASIGIVFAVAFAMHGRPLLHRTSLGLPMVIGFVPGLLLFFAFRALAQRPVVRVLVAFGALVSTAYVLTTY